MDGRADDGNGNVVRHTDTLAIGIRTGVHAGVGSERGAESLAGVWQWGAACRERALRPAAVGLPCHCTVAQGSEGGVARNCVLDSDRAGRCGMPVCECGGAGCGEEVVWSVGVGSSRRELRLSAGGGLPGSTGRGRGGRRELAVLERCAPR